MSERRVYKPGTPAARRKEWVELADGAGLWVWEMTAAESLTMGRNAERHPQDPRGPGIDGSESLLWQVMLSCYESDEEGAPRVFADHMAPAVYQLAHRDYRAILEAIARLNGTDSEGGAAVDHFTPVSAGG